MQGRPKCERKTVEIIKRKFWGRYFIPHCILNFGFKSENLFFIKNCEGMKFNTYFGSALYISNCLFVFYRMGNGRCIGQMEVEIHDYMNHSGFQHRRNATKPFDIQLLL